MKTLLILLLLVTPIAAQQDTTANPCKDRVYIALQKKNIDSLSQREFDYYILKSKQCSEYTALIKKIKSDESGIGAGGIIIIVIMGLAFLGIVGNSLKK